MKQIILKYLKEARIQGQIIMLSELGGAAFKLEPKNINEARLKKTLKTFTPTGESNPTERSNRVVVSTFMNKTFSPRTIKWGGGNLKIVKLPLGWGLLNYNTLLAFITNSGRVYVSNKSYSSSTGRIQSYIKREASDNPKVKYVNEETLYAIANEENKTRYKPNPNSIYHRRNQELTPDQDEDVYS